MKKYLLFIFVCISLIYAELIHPINDSELTYTHILFEWSEIANTATYDFQLSSTIDFTETLVSISTANLYYLEKDVIDWESNYFWRVQSQGSEWMVSTFSISENSTTFQGDNDNPIEILEHNPELASNGLTIFGSYYNNYSAAIGMSGRCIGGSNDGLPCNNTNDCCEETIDQCGICGAVEVWNSGGINTFVFFTEDGNNSFLGGKFLPDYNNSLIGCEFSLDEGIIWTESINPDLLLNETFIQHEMIKLPNGNYMGFVPIIEEHPVPTYSNFSERNTPFSWEDDFDIYIDFDEAWPWKGEKIVEWDKNSGEIVWEWNVFDANYGYNLDDFDYLAGHWETAWDEQSSFDWIHFNALVFNESENALYVSSRHLDRITKIDYSTKNIIWNMGLQWLGDEVIMPDELFSGQHGLQILDDGNIVTFDNGILSQYIDGVPKPISKAMEIKIIETNGVYSAQTIWSHALSDTLYGALSGNSQKLENGNYLINTIGNVSGAYSLEVTQDHNIVWMCKYNLGDYSTGPLYRAIRIPSLFDIDLDNLHINKIYQPSNINLIMTYPNPFNPIVNIKYEVSTLTFIQFDIHNITGQQIDEIYEGYKSPGNYVFTWNGAAHPSGIYFLTLKNNEKLLTKKMIILK